MSEKRKIVAVMLSEQALGRIKLGRLCIDSGQCADAAMHFSLAADSLRYASREMAKSKTNSKTAEAGAG